MFGSGSFLVHFALFWFLFLLFRDFNLTLLLTSYTMTSNSGVARTMHVARASTHQIRRRRQTATATKTTETCTMYSDSPHKCNEGSIVRFIQIFRTARQCDTRECAHYSRISSTST